MLQISKIIAALIWVAMGAQVAMASAVLSAGGMPLKPDDAFKLSITRDENGPKLHWTIAEGYYLYRQSLSAQQLDNGQDIPLSTIAGLLKNDANFGSVEVYYHNAGAGLPATINGKITVAYQGCKENSICYPMQTRELALPGAAVAANMSAIPASSSFGHKQAALRGPIDVAPTGQTTPNLTSSLEEKPQPARDLLESPAPVQDFALAEATDGGMISSLLASGGTVYVILAFLAFGVLLAFTPCVLPMYPVLAAMLARSGEKLTPRRGFVLSGVYAIAMAAAFALLGIAAAWSGQNLQIVLQSPYAIGAMIALFIALALSMFGVFSLQLPSAWMERISGATRTGTGSLRTAAALGFSSALVLGPCVTAPLAGALLYIGQTGDISLGAAALFALGLGQGIPLIIFGTLGGKALPRAGGWMDQVRQIFGFVFLAVAVWLSARLLPPHVVLGLWAVLLIGGGVFLGGFDTLAADAGPRARGRKAAGIAMALYGALLGVGASSGADDPLRPLERLASRATSATQDMPAAMTAFGSAASVEEFRTQLARAAASDRPSLVYFTADWCVTCKPIQQTVLPDPAISPALKDFNLIKADLSSLDADKQELMNQLAVIGPPTMIFFNADKREVAGSRLVGEITATTLAESISKAKSLE